MIEFGIMTAGRVRTYHDMRRVWVEAERLGFDYAWSADNVVGLFPGGEGAETFDAWSVLGALAEATTRIRIGPMATPCGRRNPALLAKMTSTLDMISAGRLEVGLGIGDRTSQFVPWGMQYDPRPSVRIDMLREEIEILKRMWTQDQASFRGKYHAVENAYNSPKPVQTPHPPIWIAISQNGRKLMPKLAAQYADGITLYIADDQDARERLRTIERYCGDCGRNFDRLRKARMVRVLLTPEDAAGAAGWREEAERTGESPDFMQGAYDRERQICGPPEKAIADIERIMGLGFDQLIIKFGWGWNASPDAQLAGATIFATEIMAPLRRKYPKTTAGQGTNS